MINFLYYVVGFIILMISFLYSIVGFIVSLMISSLLFFWFYD